MSHRRFIVLGAVLFVILAWGSFPVSGTSVLVERISVGSAGIGGGEAAALSADGRYVVFESFAPDLAPNQVSGSLDVYLHDRQSGQTERVSAGPGGEPVENPGAYTSTPSIADGGRLVAFMSSAPGLVPGDANGLPDIFIRDRASATTDIASIATDGSPANGPSFNPAFSPDGRYLAFQSQAGNLVPGDSNGAIDVFLRDRVSGMVELISLDATGSQGADPRDYGFSTLSVSTGGRFVAFSYTGLGGSTAETVYLRDRQLQVTRTVAPGANPALTPDGRYLAFNGLPGIQLYAVETGVLETILPGAADGSSAPALSADSRYIAFQTARGLLPEDTNGVSDIYRYDRMENRLVLVSRAYAGGASGSGPSTSPSISADGQVIAFVSSAGDLAPNDGNARPDVFILDLGLAAFIPVTGSSLEQRVFLPVLLSQ